MYVVYQNSVINVANCVAFSAVEKQMKEEGKADYTLFAIEFVLSQTVAFHVAFTSKENAELIFSMMLAALSHDQKIFDVEMASQQVAEMQADAQAKATEVATALKLAETAEDTAAVN